MAELIQMHAVPKHPRIDEAQTFSLAKRTGDPRGWQTDTLNATANRSSKARSLLATNEPVGRAIRACGGTEERGLLGHSCTKV